MKIFKKIICYTLTSIILFSNYISFADVGNSNIANNQIENSESNILIEKLYLQYPDAWKIEFISNENNFFYFRVFEKRGSRNYYIVKYNNNINNNSSKIKELIWIWSKKYDAEIRDIQFENIKGNKADAKIYLRNSKIINEKVVFIDNPTKGEYLHFIEK